MAARRDAWSRAGATPVRRRRRSFSLACGFVLLLGATACGEADEVPVAMRVVGGDPERGKELVARYDCVVCHRIPGIRGTTGAIGPSLTGFGLRGYIAGVKPNRPGFLTQWVRDPPSIAPNTAMPNLGVTEEEARHIAAYLYTLR